MVDHGSRSRRGRRGGWFLAGRERGRGLIVAVVVAAQTVLHETFSLGQNLTPGSGTPSAGMDGMHMSSSDSMASMSMNAMDMSGMTHMARGSAGMGHAHTMTGGASLGMLAAHLLAAVLCGLWLAYGERAVFRVLRAAAARLVAPLRMLLALPVPGRRPSVRRRRTAAYRSSLARFLLCYSVTSRGPPTGPAVV